MTARKLLGELFALFCSVMLGLAAGAVWLVPTLYLRRPLPVLALAFGWLLALAIRHWVYQGQRGRIALAAIATVVSIVYMCMLVAAVNIAASMDVGLIDTMRIAGAGMLLQLARVGLHGGDLAWFVAGVALSVFTASQVDKRVD